VDEVVLEEFSQKYIVPEYLFDVNYLGGWDRIYKDLYDSNGVWAQVVLELADEF